MSLSLPRSLTSLLVLSIALTLAGCGGGGGGGAVDGVGIGVGPTPASALNQAAYQGGTTYAYAHNSIPNIAIEGAPADADFSRWAMLHDGTDYRLYCFQAGSSTQLYQFAFDASRGAYVFGFRSIDRLTITGAPADASPASIAMLHDGADYRLYMRSASDPAVIYQFGFNSTSGSYEFGFRSIPSMRATGLPADADFSRWAMLYDGRDYRQYVAKAGSTNEMYQLGFDASRREYVYGFRSIANLDVVGMPANSVTTSFAMLHDGADYRFYHLVR